jgi:streptolysin S family bacteriocin protoxin
MGDGIGMGSRRWFALVPYFLVFVRCKFGESDDFIKKVEANLLAATARASSSSVDHLKFYRMILKHFIFSREHVVLARLLYRLCCCCCCCCSYWWIVTHGIRSYQLVFEVSIGIRSTNWYSKYQLVFEVPIGI